MKESLKEILEQIIKDLREQGHDPLDRPIVFIWSYPDKEFKFTLVIQKKEEEEKPEPEVFVDKGVEGNVH